MCAVAIKPSSPPKPRDVGIRRRRWNRKEYYRAAELGLFRPDERLELLDGEILERPHPQTPAHAAMQGIAARILERVFAPGHYVRQHFPLILSHCSEPEPDVLVVPGTPHDYLAGHPHAVHSRLLVE